LPPFCTDGADVTPTDVRKSASAASVVPDRRNF